MAARDPAGRLAIWYEWAFEVPNRETGAACHDVTFDQDIGIDIIAEAILIRGEFPKAGVWKWISEDTGTCTWSESFDEVGESYVYTVKTAAGLETIDADELADGVITLAGRSGTIGLIICPTKDVACL